MSFNQLIQNINAAIAHQPKAKSKRFYSYHAGGQWVKISHSRKDLSGNTTTMEHYVDMETAARITVVQENSIPTRSPIDSRDQVLQFNAIEDQKSLDKCELGIFCDLLEKSGVKLGGILDELDSKITYVREVAVRRSPTTMPTQKQYFEPWKITFKSQLQYDAFCKYVADNL